MTKPQVLIVGGGMITHDQILPAVYGMQRRDEIGEVWVCAQHGRTVRSLAAAPAIVNALRQLGIDVRDIPATPEHLSNCAIV